MSDGMDLKAFLFRREEHKRHESIRETCLRCFRPQINCLCGDILPFDTLTRIVILTHPKEAKKVKMGTGRLTHLFLTNSEMRIGVDFTHDRRVNSLINDPRYFSVVLYPGENSVEISKNTSLIRDIQDKTLLVFVIDASWPLAKKILRTSQNLQALPQIHFRPKEPSQYILKKQPHPYCLCTIESVSLLLEELENFGLENCCGKQRILMEALEKMCELQSGFMSNTSSTGVKKEKLPESERGGIPGKRQRRSVRFEDRGKR